MMDIPTVSLGAKLELAFKIGRGGLPSVSPATYWVGKLDRDSAVVPSADCMPVAVYLPDTSVAALVHLGWKDLASGKLMKAVEDLKLLGAEPHKLRVYVGPHICARCYFDTGAVGLVKKHALALAKLEEAVSYQEESWHFDLFKGLQIQLQNLGVDETQVTNSGICTFESGLPSRRREGKNKQQLYTILRQKTI